MTSAWLVTGSPSKEVVHDLRLFKKPDFVLFHPPSVYDFRQQLIVPSPIADLVPSGPFFEMYPIGFSFLGEYLERAGFSTRIVNLAGRMLKQPRFDVQSFIERTDPAAFGIGLHWLPHCHGAVEVARLVKKAHPETPVVMGGYSATLFSRELMEYPEIDYVVRGDSAEEPLRMLLEAVRARGDVSSVPNLTFRDRDGRVVENPISWVPPDLDHLGNNYAYMVRSPLKYGDIRGLVAFKDWWSHPVTAVLTCKGCTCNCVFCGGSDWSAQRCFRREGLAMRSPEKVAVDVRTIARFTGAPIFIIGDLRQSGDEYAEEVLRALAGLRLRNDVVLELFEPAPREYFELVSECLTNFNFEFSPESHDESVRLATGKKYGNQALEDSIGWALQSGCRKFDVFFMIGLPRQTPESVRETVAYCGRLLETFGSRVNPLIGPLAPFLDPGSIAHDNSERNGYRLLFHSLEDYRRALLNPHWRDALSYETRWMTRQEIVDSTYDALLELNRIKGENGLISRAFQGMMDRFLRANISMLRHLDHVLAIEDEAERDSQLRLMKGEADILHMKSSLVKEEIKWPIAGRKFRYSGILGMLLEKKERSGSGPA